MHHATVAFDGIEVSRQLVLTLLLETPPDTPSDPAVRKLQSEISVSLHESVGLSSVGIVARAGLAAYERRGVAVYARE